MRLPKIVLTEEQQTQAYVMAADNFAVSEIYSALGFKNNYHFSVYMRENPIFKLEFDAARVSTCMGLEDEALNVADRFEDAKRGRVKLESIRAILGYRDPGRYGQRIDISLNQKIDLSAVLEAANSRVLDVTPRQPALAAAETPASEVDMNIPSAVEDLL